MSRQSSHKLDGPRTVAGILLVPLLWPLAFVGSAIVFPAQVDPLLAGLQYILYLPALFWLLIVLSGTLGLAKLLKVKRTNALFISVGMCSAAAISIAFGAYGAWDSYRSIGQLGVLYPRSFSLMKEIDHTAVVTVASTAATLILTIPFVAVGAFRSLKFQET